jgi:hypothetical protein
MSAESFGKRSGEPLRILLATTALLVGAVACQSPARESTVPSLLASSPSPSPPPEIVASVADEAIGSSLGLRLIPLCGDGEKDRTLLLPQCAYVKAHGVYLLWVELRNVGLGSVRFQRRNFVMVTTGGVAYPPASWPKSLPKRTVAMATSGSIPPRARVTGVVVFDARAGKPGRISYIEGDEVLTIAIHEAA